MINLYTVANSSMFPYAKIFFGSLYKNTNLSKINKIFVLDAGLTPDQRRWLGTKYSKIEFLETGVKKDFVARKHKDGVWSRVVSLKTRNLRSLFSKDSTRPYIMLDLDSYFVQDFYNDINFDEDFNVGICKRTIPLGKAAYIGSFFIANNKRPSKTKSFFDLWIEIMKSGRGVLRESPSLCRLVSGRCHAGEVLSKPLKGYKIKEFSESVFSCYRGFSEKTNIVHFKSFGSRTSFNNPNGYARRFARIHGGFGGTERVKEFLEEGYLERHCNSLDFSAIK